MSGDVNWGNKKLAATHSLNEIVHTADAQGSVRDLCGTRSGFDSGGCRFKFRSRSA